MPGAGQDGREIAGCPPCARSKLARPVIAARHRSADPGPINSSDHGLGRSPGHGHNIDLQDPAAPVTNPATVRRSRCSVLVRGCEGGGRPARRVRSRARQPHALQQSAAHTASWPSARSTSHLERLPIPGSGVAEVHTVIWETTKLSSPAGERTEKCCWPVITNGPFAPPQRCSQPSIALHTRARTEVHAKQQQRSRSQRPLSSPPRPTLKTKQAFFVCGSKEVGTA